MGLNRWPQYDRVHGGVAIPRTQFGRGGGFPTGYRVQIPRGSQGGNGIASFFKGIGRRAKNAGRRAMPGLKNMGKSILKNMGAAAMPVLQETMQDVLSGKNVKQSLKSGAKKAGKASLAAAKSQARDGALPILMDAIAGAQEGNGRKRGRVQKRKPRKKTGGRKKKTASGGKRYRGENIFMM